MRVNIKITRSVFTRISGRIKVQSSTLQSLGAFAKLQKLASSRPSVCLSVHPFALRPYETNRVTINWFLQNLIFQYLSKICRENSSFIKI